MRTLNWWQRFYFLKMSNLKASSCLTDYDLIKVIDNLWSELKLLTLKCSDSVFLLQILRLNTETDTSFLCHLLTSHSSSEYDPVTLIGLSDTALPTWMAACVSDSSPCQPEQLFLLQPKNVWCHIVQLVFSSTNSRLWSFFSTQLSVTRCSTSSHLRLNNMLSHCWGLEEADGSFTAQWEEIIPQNVVHNRPYLYYSQNRFVGLSQSCAELPFLLQELNLLPVYLI